MQLSLWLSLVAICVMGAMSPGPSLALVLRHTLGGGRIRGVTAALTHALGVGFYALLTVLGLGALIVSHPQVFQWITWLGAAYLAWLGIKALRAGSAGVLSPALAATTQRQAVKEALLVALCNPKLILFFVALLSQFVTPQMGFDAKAIVVITAMVIDGGWYLLVALGLSHSSILPWLQRYSHWVNRVTGIFLIALALRVVAGPLV
ncbi:LysE family translocator [Vreelandella sp. GE22]